MQNHNFIAVFPFAGGWSVTISDRGYYAAGYTQPQAPEKACAIALVEGKQAIAIAGPRGEIESWVNVASL